MNDAIHHSFLDVILEVKRLTFSNVKPNALAHCIQASVRNRWSCQNKYLQIRTERTAYNGGHWITMPSLVNIAFSSDLIPNYGPHFTHLSLICIFATFTTIIYHLQTDWFFLGTFQTFLMHEKKNHFFYLNSLADNTSYYICKL